MRGTRYLMVMTVMALLVTLGCATAGSGKSDLELIQAKMADCVASANAQNLDAVFAHFAEDFYCPQLGDKEDFRDFVENAKGSGFLDGLEISTEDAEITIEGDTAMVSPVDIRGSFGSGEGDFVAKKINGVWMITEMDIAGI